MDHKRLLWNSPEVIAASAVTLVVTLAIISLQMSMRQGVFDPESLDIFRRLFLFQDYPAAFLFIVVVFLALVPTVQEAGMRFAEQIARHPVRCAVVVFLALAASARYAYLAQPLSMDEAAAVMQGTVFAAGSLAGQLPAELLDWLVFPPF